MCEACSGSSQDCGFFFSLPSISVERGGGPLGYLAAQSLYLKCLG